MKKLFLGVAAFAAMIFASSCQQEKMEQPAAQETTVTYTVELPAEVTKTKAIGDASTVDQLIYEVWKTEKADERDLNGVNERGERKATRLYHDETSLVERNGKTCAVVTFNLVQDQEYTILFWAQKRGTGVYNTENLTKVHYSKNTTTAYLSNQEDYAAFYASSFVSDEDSKSRTVVLTRPFAQINIATSNPFGADNDDPNKEYSIEVVSSTVRVKSVGTAFNVAKNVLDDPKTTENEYVSGVDPETTVSFVFNTAPDPSGDNEYIWVNNQKYEYVAMNYVLASAGTVQVDYEINTVLTSRDAAGDGLDKTNATVSNTVVNVPVKENYRTNIVGNLLTSTTEYYVEIDNNWADMPGDGTEVEVWDGKNIQKPYFNTEANQYEISLATELAWLAAAVNGDIVDPELDVKSTGYVGGNSFNGKTFVLKENIDLKGFLWTPIGAKGKFEGTFDGNGKTIKNLYVDIDQLIENERNIENPLSKTASVGLFGTTKNATIKNVTVQKATVNGHYKAAVIVADGVCANIENCHVKDAKVTSTTYAGHNDDANHVGGIVGYLSGEDTGFVRECSVMNTEVKGYRDVAGIAGTANVKAVVSGNEVDKVIVIADQTVQYDAVKVANVDAIAGRVSAEATVENSKVRKENVYVLVNTAANLEYQIANESRDIKVVLAGNITGDVMIHEKPGKDVIIDGAGYKYDGTIKIHNGSNDNDGTVTIENVNFETSTESLNFIMPNEFGVENGVTRRYSQNVTVSNCTFNAQGAAENTAVGVQAKSSKNLVVKNCRATNMHSLIQAQSCGENVEVKNCTVNGKNGVAFKQVETAVVEGCTIEAAEYGIRFDGNIDNYGITVKDNNVTAIKPFIIRRMTGANNTIVLEGENTFTTEETFQIVITDGEDDADYVCPTGSYTITGHEGFNVYPINDKESLAAAINNSKLDEVNVEGKIESVGTGFEVKRDVVLDFNNQELNAGSTANSTWYAIEAFGDYDVVIENANFTRAGVFAAEGADVVFNNGIINHKPERTSRYIFCSNSGATITILDGTFKNDRAKNAYFWADNSTIYVKGGNFGGVASNNKVVESKGGKVIISGGTFNFDPTQWLEPGYVAVKTGSTWTVSAANQVTTAAELTSALVNAEDGDIIVLAPGTYEGTFTPSKNVTLKSASTSNKSVIAGRVNVKGVSVDFKNVDFKVTDDSKVKWTTGGSDMKSKPAIIMSELNEGELSFENCNFELTTSAGALTTTTSAMSIFKGCTFTGSYRYPIYSRANIEVSNCTYSTTMTDVLVGVCCNSLANGKVVFKNNTLENGTAIGLTGAVVFCSTNNEGGKWAGPVEFNVQGNTGFAYSYERMNNFPVNQADHTFVEGSDVFSF